jgi:hypothetical protein
MIPGRMSKLTESKVASAASISVNSDIVYLTGTTGVSFITPPRNGGFAAPVFFVPLDGAIIFSIGGNITVAATLPLNKATLFVYSKLGNVWLPGAIS